MPRKRQESIDASHLLNFHSGISESLPSTSDSHHHNTPQQRREAKKAYKKQQAQYEERQIRDRLHKSFFLHTSPLHSFVISRKQKGSSTAIANKSIQVDKVKDWSSVKIVKCFVPSDDSSNLMTCAICLDEYVAPRITECGHIFCYPCFMRHMYANNNVSATASSTATGSTKMMIAKCPCCFHLTSQSDLRPVEFVTVQSPHQESKQQPTMEFRKLFRCKSGSAPFVPCTHGIKTMHIKRRKHLENLPSANDVDAMFSRYTYLHYDSYLEHFQNDLVSLNQEMDNIVIMYATLMDNMNKMQEESCENDKYYVSMAIAAVQVEYETALEGRKEEQRLSESMKKLFEKDYIDVVPYKEEEKNHQENVDKCNEEMLNDNVPTETKKNQKGFQYGKMYASNDYVQFYQSTDGQLCFLSGFNLNCLSHEFSVKDPVFESFDSSNSSSNKAKENAAVKPPYPDIIKGKIVEVERIHLTPEVRNRMKIFAHLPLYTDVTICELDINKNLSEETKKICKKDMDKRRKKRQAKKDAEKRAEKEIEMREKQRMEEISRGIQRIDPNDSFFHSVTVPTEETNVFDASDFEQFLPVKPEDRSSSSTTQNSPHSNRAVSFSSVTANSNQFAGLDEAFPTLGSANDEAFPSLGSTPSRQSSSQSAWGSSSSSRGGKKKGKQSGVVLFSTGGRRGGRL